MIFYSYLGNHDIKQTFRSDLATACKKYYFKFFSISEKNIIIATHISYLKVTSINPIFMRKVFVIDITRYLKKKKIWFGGSGHRLSHLLFKILSTTLLLARYFTPLNPMDIFLSKNIGMTPPLVRYPTVGQDIELYRPPRGGFWQVDITHYLYRAISSYIE